MSTVFEVITLAIAIPAALESLNRLIPAPQRMKVVGAIGSFADSENGKKFNNLLIAMASIGIMIEGFVFSFLIFSTHSSKVGFYSALGLFTAFAVAALYIFKMGNRQ
ncbi:hypothetical protein [Chryseobacterium sp. SL1]|uniref:hypothetical protein n=1 Tax=Chryseobacterium sp. SL1 TaxID=2995159 RepID=UPI002274F568|nr:hypothetical protein [Chryseobacterium sp. SL1]MCY1662610.1 hypothetical protein [Chryseobacterium sp. SL1]